MKTLKQIIAVTGLAVLLAGCATTDSNSGSASGSEMGMGNQRSAQPAPAQIPMGNNGSVGPGNPLGTGPGSGFQ